MKPLGILAVVFACSFAAAWLLPVSDMTMPAVLALIGVLYQLMRDEALHLKTIEMQKQQHIFELGAMSHMANVAFDKHVEFCECYMKEVHHTVSTLFKEGPTAKSLTHANKFAEIRQEFAAWVTDEISEKLFLFEKALRDMGAAKAHATSLSGEAAHDEERRKAIRTVWEQFNKILTIQGEPPDESIAIEAVKKKIREILDIEDLIGLRKRLILQAGKSLDTHN